MPDRFKRIFANAYEAESHKTLAAVAKRYDAQVFAKVRVADALDITRSGLSGREYTYALRAHFDFIVADADSQPKFAVEFDGPQHSSDPDVVYRDSLKDSICDRFGFPLLRIDSGFMRQVGRFTLLGYLAGIWFLNEGFYEAQMRGEVPFDEPFHPAFIVADSLDPNEIGKNLFPYDLSRDAKRYMVPLMNRGECTQYQHEPYLSGTDPAGYAVELAIFEVNGELIIGVGRCRLYRFPPLPADELALDLAWFDAADKVRRYRHGSLSPATQDEVAAWMQRMREWDQYR